MRTSLPANSPLAATALLLGLWLAAAAGLPPAPLGALDEPLPAYEKGLYDWTGADWGLQHHIQIMTGYDDNPLRGNYSRHPLPDFNLRADYGTVFGRYLDRNHYTRITYDAQARAWARYTDLNTVDHTLTARFQYFDPAVDVTGAGWFVKPQALALVCKAPQDFIAGQAPRRLHLDLAFPAGWVSGAERLEIAPLWRQERYLDGDFAVLDRREAGAYAEWEHSAAARTSAVYFRWSYRSIAFRRNDVYDNFSVHAGRAGWRLQTDELGCDLGLDAALFARQSNRAADNTPQSQVNLSPYLAVRWRIDPDRTRLNFALQRFFTADTAVSGTALTQADFRLTHVIAPDLIEVGVLSRLVVNSRLNAGSATLFTLQVDANLRIDKGDWPPVTVVAALGLDANRDDLAGNSYLARTAELGFRAVF